MDVARIEAIIEIVKDAHVCEVSVSGEGSSVLVRKPPVSFVHDAPAAQAKRHDEPRARKNAKGKPKTPETDTDTGTIITAPMVGIFHMIDGINIPGVVVKKGQVVGAIESMKLMNDVVSDMSGDVVELYVEDGMPVEYGQSLFRLNGV
ncbi:MAG: hypothetical protein HYX78_00210 [Armatimonadetes bacterium]|nr:hypothetical protein [Armatimonadota bacterium]